MAILAIKHRDADLYLSFHQQPGGPPGWIWLQPDKATEKIRVAHFYSRKRAEDVAYEFALEAECYEIVPAP